MLPHTVIVSKAILSSNFHTSIDTNNYCSSSSLLEYSKVYQWPIPKLLLNRSNYRIIAYQDCDIVDYYYYSSNYYPYLLGSCTQILLYSIVVLLSRVVVPKFIIILKSTIS